MARWRARPSAAALIKIFGWLAIVVAVVWFLASLARGDEPIGALPSLLLAIAGVASQVLVIPDRPAPADQPIEEIADQLARTAYTQLSEEAGARGLRTGRMIPVQWATTELKVADPPTRVTRADGSSTRIGRFTLKGGLIADADRAAEALTADFRSLPNGRLVILGEPGAGKSVLALLLALGLLDGRAGGSSVALLLSASSWDPPREDFDSWIVRTVAETYYNGRSDIPRRLVDRGLILPVIDGIDEIYELGRDKALGALNDALVAGRPIVVTCRSVEYQDLIAGGADAVREAPVIEIKPIPAPTLVAFLRESPRPEPWTRIIEHLEAHEDGVVARSLSTPLMASFARTAYGTLHRDPSELLHEERFATRNAIEDHVVDRMVDAAYPPDGTPSADQAREWLGALAQEMLARHERDLQWWSLVPRLVGAWIGPAVGVASGLAFMAATTLWMVALSDGNADLAKTLTYAAWVGGVLAVLSIVAWYAAGDRPPRRASWRAHRDAAQFRTGLLQGAAIGAFPAVPTALSAALIITLSGGWTLWNLHTYLRAVGGVIGLVLAVGLALGLQRWADSPPDRAIHATPAKSLIDDRNSAFIGALVAGVTLSALAFLITLLGIVLTDLATSAASRWSGWPGTPALSPVLDAALADLLPGPAGSLTVAVGAYFVLPGLALAFLVLMTRAWPRFMIVSGALAARRRLPWRLNAFLAGARDRGLLRQSGTAYQFRHIRLQDRLADQRAPRPVHHGTEQVNPARARTRRLAFAAVVLAASGAVLTRVPRDNALFVLSGKHGLGPYEASVSPDGTLVALSSAKDPTVSLWDTASGRKVAELGGNTGGAGAVSFTANNRLAVVEGGTGTDPLAPNAPNDNAYRVFDLSSGRPIATADEAYVLASGRTVATSHYIAPGSDQPAVELWSAATGKRLVAMEGERIKYNPDLQESDLLITGAGEVFRARDARTGDRKFDVPPGVVPASHVTTFLVSTGARRLTMIDTGRVSTYDTATGRRLWGFSGFDSELANPERLDAATERSIVTSGRLVGVKEDDDTVALLDLRNGRRLPLISGVNSIRTAKFDGGGRYVVVLSGDDPRDLDSTLDVFDAATGQAVVASRPVSFYNIDPTGKLLSLRGPETDQVELFDLRSRKVHTVLEDSAGENLFLSGETDLEFSPDGTALYSIGGVAFRVWSATTGALLAEGTRNLGTDLPHVRVSPSGDVIAVREERGVRLWETRTGRDAGLIDGARLGPDPGGDYPYSSDRAATTAFRIEGDQLIFDDDAGRVFVLIAGEERVRVFDTRTARLLTTYVGHRGPIRSMALAPDGETLLTSGAKDNTVRLWR
ncbi:PQQ-binding-like beta-propeller repeat protein [Actinoplanes sp. NPDC051861]|uniref:NACHT and WD40 repeat domain-containing protein n=1 Tax=Actinoplanes sp. NPDC051861 TaxID=3155170 RepID=UPI00341D3000